MKRRMGLDGEFEGLSLGDGRLERRALAIVNRAVVAPARSFPQLLPNSAELEGAYRFFQNEAVSPEELLRPHIEATFARARTQRIVRIAHDTTGMSFGGDREGLGRLARGGSGFWAHMALAISDGEERAPLGIVGLETKVYPSAEERHKEFLERRRQFRREKLTTFPAQKVLWPVVEKWAAIPQRIRTELRGVHVVHVMDQEADAFELLALLKKRKLNFVIRGASGRCALSAEGGHAHVEDELAKAAVVVRRRVKLTARPREEGGHPARQERVVTLSLRGAHVTLRSGGGTKLSLNVVEAFEAKPPPGEEAVSWVLFTTEPVDTPEQVAAVVDHYRARWRIEEYFKALKTGCSIERRQLTTYDGLRRTLALFIPVAWHLLAIRTAAQQERPIAASSVITAEQLTLLRVLASERDIVLSNEPDARAALSAIAALGGHLKRNGDPGWMTLSRGFDRLRDAESIWRLATRQTRTDQS